MFNKVPWVSGKLPFNIFQKALGTVQVKLLFTTKEKTQQPVKAYEMIHMRVADKNMADLENISGRKWTDVSQIENYGTFFKKKGDE